MFDELEKYNSNDHFFFNEKDELRNVCNAPKDGIGIYLIYALKNGRIELVYIGSSGKIKQNGISKIRNGGMFDRIVNGKQFQDVRRKSWKEKIVTENIDALDIYWYETFNDNHKDIPAMIEGAIIQQYFNIYGELPSWNKEY